MLLPLLIFFLVSVAGLAYGTYTDFKERLVSNYVTYGMIALGLLGHAAWAFIAADIWIFAWSAILTAVTFAGSLLLYKAGMWAGGDVKLFTGLAALNPFNPNILTGLGIIAVPFFQSIALPVFPLTLFMFSLFAMLPYGAGLAFARLLKNQEEKKKFKADFAKRIIDSAALAAAAAGLSTLMQMLELNQLLVLPLLFVAMLLPKKLRVCVAVVLFAAGVWLGWEQALYSFAVLFLLLIGLYLLVKLYSLSKVLMRKPVKISELEEGMISAETIVQKGKVIETLPEMGIKKLINYFVLNRLQGNVPAKEECRVIVSSRAAAGLSEEQIKELQRLAKEKRIDPSIKVKESAPFVPAVLIAYIALNVVGDAIWFWLI